MSAAAFQVAALYVDPKGPYRTLAADCWGEARDATKYAGSLPVIAHPPCGPWGRLYRNCTRQRRDLAVIAVSQVRRWRGILEHPAYSKLWPECGMPRPGSLYPDEFGGRSYVVYQGDFGHKAPKLTWLYVVGLPPPPTGFINGQGGQTGRIAGLKRNGAVSKDERRLTPEPFARLLCQWASS